MSAGTSAAPHAVGVNERIHTEGAPQEPGSFTLFFVALHTVGVRRTISDMRDVERAIQTLDRLRPLGFVLNRRWGP